MLNHFFVVTLTSIYEIVAKGAESLGLPVVQKIAMDSLSAIATGQELKRGNVVAIGANIWTYDIDLPTHRAESINAYNWLGHTSPVVGLFKTVEEARMCFKHRDRVAADLRWEKESREVLQEIGPNHPVFYLFEDPSLQLFPA